MDKIINFVKIDYRYFVMIDFENYRNRYYDPVEWRNRIIDHRNRDVAEFE